VLLNFWVYYASIKCRTCFLGTRDIYFSLSFGCGIPTQPLGHARVLKNLPGAGKLDPRSYETIASPISEPHLGEAHRIHHAFPSLLGKDPDTVHPLFRVHKKLGGNCGTSLTHGLVSFSF